MRRFPGTRNRPGACGCALALACLLLAGGSGCEGQPPANDRSLVMIVVDTLRADHLGAYRYHLPTSPSLDERFRNGALFERAVASSPWTLPSFATLLTGRTLSRHGAGRRISPGSRRRVGALDPSLPVLAGLLGAQGYQTAAFVTNAYLREAFGLGRGFETYSCRPATNRSFRRAAEGVTKALEWLDARDARPFFLLLHFFEPHLNYEAVPETRGSFTAEYQGPLELPIRGLWELRRTIGEMDEGDRDFIRAAYDEEILAVDRQLGRFFRALDDRGITDDAVVVFTSDHGEEFFEHGGFEHGHAAYQELLHVPLVFWGPGVPPARIETPVSHLDIFPTLLDALDLSIPDDLPGISLWPLMTQGDAIPTRGILAEGTLYGPPREVLIRWPWKLIQTGKARRMELFELDRDPEERRDLAQELPDRAEELRRELRLRVSSARAGLRQQVEAEIDEETREQLKSLGYLE
jgi:choline-sulfatase